MLLLSEAALIVQSFKGRVMSCEVFPAQSSTLDERSNLVRLGDSQSLKCFPQPRLCPFVRDRTIPPFPSTDPNINFNGWKSTTFQPSVQTKEDAVIFSVLHLPSTTSISIISCVKIHIVEDTVNTSGRT